MCGATDHWAKDCLDWKYKQSPKKTTNVVLVNNDAGTAGYMVIHSKFFQLDIYLIGGLTPGQIYMCVLIFLCFLLTRSAGLEPC